MLVVDQLLKLSIEEQHDEGVYWKDSSWSLDWIGETPSKQGQQAVYTIM